MLKVPSRCHSSEFMDALDIESTKDFCIRMKIKFAIRLSNNTFTKNILDFMCMVKDHNTTEIANLLNLNSDYDSTALILACKNYVEVSTRAKFEQKKKSYLLQRRKSREN